MWVVDQIARELEGHSPPYSAEVIAHLEAVVKREGGKVAIAMIREAGEDLVRELLAERGGDGFHGDNLRAAADAWAVRWGLDSTACPACGEEIPRRALPLAHAPGCPLADNA